MRLRQGLEMSSNIFETKNVELELKYVFEMSFEKRVKNDELREVKFWNVFWLISIINTELQLKKIRKGLGKI